jgi:hypothetical protein
MECFVAFDLLHRLRDSIWHERVSALPRSLRRRDNPRLQSPLPYESSSSP